MAEKIIMPKLGNTVESVVIVEWKKEVGEVISLGDALCEVETDKTSVDVEAEISGVLLAQLHGTGDDVPVLTPFAIVGDADEEVLKKDDAKEVQDAPGISPRARNLAASSGLSELPIKGSGPNMRVVERDIHLALKEQKPLKPSIEKDFPGPFKSVPLKGVRLITAQRMHASLMESAQLTLNSSASAASLLSWRAELKNSPKGMGFAAISINDLIMFAVARTLPKHPVMNAIFTNGEIREYQHVHLGFAVDSPRGLMVPVIRYANRLSLSELSVEARRLTMLCREGRANPENLTGGTFTITNLGALGVETFTPVLNVPQVGILGVGAILNAPIELPGGGIGLEKRIGLSLTIDHQAVDGAPGARFLKDLAEILAHLEWAVA